MGLKTGKTAFISQHGSSGRVKTGPCNKIHPILEAMVPVVALQLYRMEGHDWRSDHSSLLTSALSSILSQDTRIQAITMEPRCLITTITSTTDT